MFTTFITEFYKSIVSAVLAMKVATTAALPGSMGDYAELEAKMLTMGPSVTETVIEIELDVAAVEALIGEEAGLPEIPGVYEDGKLSADISLYSYGDLEEFKAVISFGEDFTTAPAVFVDAEGIALNGPALEAVLAILPAIDSEYVKYLSIYKTYFPGEGFYYSWNDLFGADFTEEEIPAEFIDLFNMAVTDITTILTSEENLKAYSELCAPMYAPMEKFYSEKTVNGAASYTEKATIKELLAAAYEVSEISTSPEMMESAFDYLKALADDIDYVKYIGIYNSFAPEGSGLALPEGTTNEVLVPMILGFIDSAKAEIMASYTEEELGNPYEFINVILTGKDESGDFAELVEILPILTPFIENSFCESTISEKDGEIITSSGMYIGDGKATYLTFEALTTTKKYEGTIPSAAAAIPFDKRVEAIELDNKLGYEDAIAKGVKSIDISWNSIMYPDEAELYIVDPGFYVNYKSSMIDSIINDPAFKAMDEETQKLLLGMYDETDSEFKYCDSSAELIDNSVYLPLRQIMENAGYEVSWDGEQRKAYVTVAGEKIEMTGVIVNDRTYVKIRDFEKLGATIEYTEDFYYENAYNDFDKECYVTITFTK